VHHFKWSGDVVERLKERVRFYKQSREPIWTESQRCVEHIVEHGGRLDVSDPRLLLAEGSTEYPHWQTVKQLVRRRMREERLRSGL
jgi:hypothetical protein